MSLYKRKSQFVVWQHSIQRPWWTDNILGIDLATICQRKAFVTDLNATVKHEYESYTYNRRSDRRNSISLIPESSGSIRIFTPFFAKFTETRSSAPMLSEN